MEDFEEYLRQGEPGKAEKAICWKTAIGLQQVAARMTEKGHIQLVESANDPGKGKHDPVNDPVNRNILKQNPKANYTELADKAGCSTATIKRHIQELKKMGILESIGSDKTGTWKIVVP